jgi:hypothetical protein
VEKTVENFSAFVDFIPDRCKNQGFIFAYIAKENDTKGRRFCMIF